MPLILVLSMLRFGGGGEHSPPAQQRAVPLGLQALQQQEMGFPSQPPSYTSSRKLNAPPRPKSLPLGPVGGQLLPAPSLSVRSRGGKRRKKELVQGAERRRMHYLVMSPLHQVRKGNYEGLAET